MEIKKDLAELIMINDENKLYLDLTNNKLNNIMENFVNKQSFITKIITKPIMKSNYIDNIDNFVKSVKEGKNQYQKTTMTLTNIFFDTITEFLQKYNSSETNISISQKVKSIFT